jgi:hypothetical protein
MVVALLTTTTVHSTLAAKKDRHTVVTLASMSTPAPKAEMASCKNVCPKTGVCLDRR